MTNLQKIAVFNLVIIFSLVAFSKADAESANTALSLSISGGSLSIEAPQNADFAGKNFSFEGQISENNSLGTINVTDERGTKAGWSIDISASDWEDGTKLMKYNGDGELEGQLALDIPEISAVSKIAGDETINFSMGTDDNFDSSTEFINFVVVPSGSGSGEYSFSGLSADQFIPGNQDMGSYTTNLILTIS